MAQNEWQRRIARAEQLGAQYTFAAEMLRFYAAVARFQESMYREFDGASSENGGVDSGQLAGPLPRELVGHFGRFLALVEEGGPAPLREAARGLRNHGGESHAELLATFWNSNETGSPSELNDFVSRALLQPYAASVRVRSGFRWNGAAPFLCPFCNRKPGVGVLRPLGDGGQRSLVCSFCLAEWEFRRIVCPGCGEEDHAKLPVYTAEELKHVRVEACDSCRIYIKTVDMTKSGWAEPVVDEIAAIPLDVWAQQHGYTKLQVNLLQM
jgi:FdhE protein